MANENYFFTSFISIISRANRTVGRASARATSSPLKAVSCRSFYVVKTAVSTVSCAFKQSGISSTMIQSILCCCFVSVFYDIGSPKARAENQELKINVNLNKRSVWETRLWEIRISQIPFSSKAPSGCLQHFTGVEGKYLPDSLSRSDFKRVLSLTGIIQTFNFADNGRHLANQNYRSCVRQEKGKCSIQYEPCDEHSFRIGPMRGNGMPGSTGNRPGSTGNRPGGSGGAGGGGTGTNGGGAITPGTSGELEHLLN